MYIVQYKTERAGGRADERKKSFVKPMSYDAYKWRDEDNLLCHHQHSSSGFSRHIHVLFMTSVVWPVALSTLRVTGP